jgi:hypothetical protein
MNPSDQDRLLQKILNDEEAATFREASLAGGLAFIKRRRRRRLLAQTSAWVIISLVLVAALLFRRGVSTSAPTRRVATVISQPAVPPSEKPESESVKSLTADELFALLPHHSLALIGKPGHQQLICLDQIPGDSTNETDSDSAVQ